MYLYKVFLETNLEPEFLCFLIALRDPSDVGHVQDCRTKFASGSSGVKGMEKDCAFSSTVSDPSLFHSRPYRIKRY